MTIKGILKRLDENGVSLMEVLVSVVLLSIILTSFLTLFIQSAKTGKASEEVIDNTYMAQKVMEEIYHISLEANYKDLDLTMAQLGYLKKSADSKLAVFEKEDGVYIRVKLKKESASTGIINVVVEVYAKKDGPLRAKMEDILEWGPN